MPKPRHPVIAALLVVARGSDPSGTAPPTRSYHMGFSAFPPRPDTTLVLPTLTLATQHSDAGLVQLSIPWQVLLDGISAAEEVRTVRLPLANYYRAVGQPITVALDVTDGLNRAQESPELIAAGRSITEPPVQELYRRYVNAVDTILRPEYLSLAAETNLIRLAAPAPVYSAIVAMASAAAGDLRARGTSSRLLVSVQVETAWGARLPLRRWDRAVLLSLPRRLQPAGRHPPRLLQPAGRRRPAPPVGAGRRVARSRSRGVAVPARLGPSPLRPPGPGRQRAGPQAGAGGVGQPAGAGPPGVRTEAELPTAYSET